MKIIQKSLLNRIFLNPLGGLGISIGATCITLWHNYALFFVIAIVIAPILWSPFVFKKVQNYFLMNFTTFFLASCFNLFGLILLFFPEVNGFAKVYFLSPPTISYFILTISIGIFLFFSMKKIYEIDYNKMHEYALKNKMFDKQQDTAYVNLTNFAVAPMQTTVRFLKQTENLLFRIGAISIGIIAIPALSLSSMMTRTGNGFFVAFFFFVGIYTFFWFSFFCAISNYVQYRFIQKLEAECGKKLKFALKEA